MKYVLDTSEMTFQAGGPVVARMEYGGREGAEKQRRDKESGLPQWSVTLVVWTGTGDDRSVDTIPVTVAAESPPRINQMDFVEVTRLQMVPWLRDETQKSDRQKVDGPKSVSIRIAYRAESIESVKPVSAGVVGKTAA